MRPFLYPKQCPPPPSSTEAPPTSSFSQHQRRPCAPFSFSFPLRGTIPFSRPSNLLLCRPRTPPVPLPITTVSLLDLNPNEHLPRRPATILSRSSPALTPFLFFLPFSPSSLSTANDQACRPPVTDVGVPSSLAASSSPLPASQSPAGAPCYFIYRSSRRPSPLTTPCRILPSCVASPQGLPRFVNYATSKPRSQSHLHQTTALHHRRPCILSDEFPAAADTCQSLLISRQPSAIPFLCSA